MSAAGSTGNAYRSGTNVVAGLLGATAFALLVLAGRLADWIHRDQAPAHLIAALALTSLVGSGLSVVAPGIWRTACLVLAVVPLLWVVSAVARVA